VRKEDISYIMGLLTALLMLILKRQKEAAGDALATATIGLLIIFILGLIAWLPCERE